jgi:arylsulfatase A-like enzyme
MVAQMDAAIGRLLDALRRSGRARDTLVVFTSDHGPLAPLHGHKPVRGGKATLYEGGLRIPLVLRWPERIPAGAVRETLVSGADLFPTLLAAAGAERQAIVDGLNLWPVIEESGATLIRPELCWHYPHYHHLGLGPCGAIHVGDYKLIEWFEPVFGASSPHAPYELFNLARDPGEMRNLADADPERRDTLLRQLRKWRSGVGAQSMKPNSDYDAGSPTRVLPPLNDLPTEP